MGFRKAEEKDLSDIMKIIHQAQEDLRAQGIDQWQEGYPNEEIVRKDISRQESYVLEKAGELIATVAVSFEAEPSYERIYEGAWKTQVPYGVIHRIAVRRDKKRLGAATEILNKIIHICREGNIFSLRIDTHRDNKGMQSWIERNHFEYCGIIYLQSSGAPRNAYERRL